MNESDNDGRATLTLEHAEPSCDRNWAPAGFDRRHNFTVGFRLSAAVAERRDGYDNVVKAIVNDWQLNGVFAAFSGNAVHGDGKRHAR